MRASNGVWAEAARQQDTARQASGYSGEVSTTIGPVSPGEEFHVDKRASNYSAAGAWIACCMSWGMTHLARQKALTLSGGGEAAAGDHPGARDRPPVHPAG